MEEFYCNLLLHVYFFIPAVTPVVFEILMILTKLFIYKVHTNVNNFFWFWLLPFGVIFYLPCFPWVLFHLYR